MTISARKRILQQPAKPASLRLCKKARIEHLGTLAQRARHGKLELGHHNCSAIPSA